MLRLKNLANKYQKRTCRPLYANTQATPYAANLTADYRVDGALEIASVQPAVIVTGSKGSLLPGQVVYREKDSEKVKVATNAAVSAKQKPFGLLANFVGGDLDEGFSGDSLQNSVGVWRGPDAVFEILAPAFDDTGEGSDYGGSLDDAIGNAGVGGEVLLYAGEDGRLVALDGGETAANFSPVARLVEKVSSTRIVVDLIV